MTAVVTAASGYDLGYVWKNQAEKDPAKAAEREHATDRASYYMQKGEPAGRWFGRGAEALGLAKGQEVERAAVRQGVLAGLTRKPANSSAASRRARTSTTSC